MDLDSYLGLPTEMYGGSKLPYIILGKTQMDTRDPSDAYIVVEQVVDLSGSNVDSLVNLQKYITDNTLSVFCITGPAVLQIVKEFQSLDETDDLENLNKVCLKHLFFEGEAGSAIVSDTQLGFISFIHGLHTRGLLILGKNVPKFTDSVAKKYTWVTNRLNEFTPLANSDTIDAFGELTKQQVLENWKVTVGVGGTDLDYIKLMEFLMNPAELLTLLKETPVPPPKQSLNSETMESTVGPLIDDIAAMTEGKGNSKKVSSDVIDTSKRTTGGFSLPSYPRTAEQYLMDME